MILLAHFLLCLLTFVTQAENPHELPIFGDKIQNISTTMGKEAIFYCRIHNIGSYRAEWVKISENGSHVSIRNLGRRVSLMYYDEVTWPLRIENVQGEDSGTYMCKVNTNPITMQMAHLHVSFPPKILDEDSSKDIEIEEGSPVTLVCKASGFPSPSIKWKRKGDKEITYFSNYSGVRRERDYSGENLHIIQITREDAGIYYCFALNGIPPAPSKRIMLDVHFSPEMKVPNYKFEVALGKDVTLICKVESNPKPKITWLHSGEELYKSDKYDIIDDTFQINGSYFIIMKLRLTNFTEADIGNYTCTSTTALGYSESTIKVYGKGLEYEEYEQSFQQLNEMESNCILDLKSNTYVNPCCKKSKLGIPVRGLIIYLRQAKEEEDISPLPCSKTINSFRPEMQVPQYTMESWIGNNVTIRCIVGSYPKPVNAWLLPGNNKISKTNPKYEIREEIRRINFSYIYTMLLLVKGFTLNDATNYTCSSRNRLGYSSSTIRVFAKRPAKSSEETKSQMGVEEPNCILDYNMNNYRYPCCRRNQYPGGSNVYISNYTIGARVGENVTAVCKILSTPSNVNKWTKYPSDNGNGTVKTNEKFQVVEEIVGESVSYQKKNLHLTIKNFSKEDAGQYSCSTKNELEYKSAIIQFTALADLTKNKRSIRKLRSTIFQEMDPSDTYEVLFHYTPDFPEGIRPIFLNANCQHLLEKNAKIVRHWLHLSKDKQSQILNSTEFPNSHRNEWDESLSKWVHFSQHLPNEGKVERRNWDLRPGSPRLETPCHRIEHLRGTHVTLMCSVKSFPRSLNTWTKFPDKQIKTNKKYELTEEHKGYFKITMRLQIKNFSQKDESVYTCSAQNSFGFAEAAITLYGIAVNGTEIEDQTSSECVPSNSTSEDDDTSPCRPTTSEEFDDYDEMLDYGVYSMENMRFL